MKSDIVQIDNQGRGFADALKITGDVAVYRELDSRNSLQLQLLTEEMLSLARSVTGELQAAFWIEGENREFILHMATKTLMDKEKRNLLISAASSRKNEAAKGFLGRLRELLLTHIKEEEKEYLHKERNIMAGVKYLLVQMD